MVCTLLPIIALAAEPSGSIERAGITHAGGYFTDAVSVDLKNVTFKTSVQVQLYRDETLLTTATLQGVNPGSHGFLTCCIATQTADKYWELTPWTPKDNIVPNKAVLFVDGHEQDMKTFTLDANEWAALPGTYGGSIERAAITHDNSVLKNAVSVDLKNVTFAESVAVKLYSGETLLTTATLKPGVLTVDQNHPFVTCCIPTEGEDDAWALTRWTPRDNVVPNKVVLFVDGHEQNTKTFTLDTDEWAALPGTAFPYSGSTGTGVTTYPITVNSAKNGDVTASHKSASKGALVTLTVTPDKGYVLETLNAFDQNGSALPLTQQNGKYTFTMPASKVTVEAMFKAAGNNPFTDVPAGSYYEDAVIWAVGKGITSGTSAVTFDPNGNCTRAQAVTFLWRAAGSPAAKSKVMPFTDVPSGSYYYDAVLWAMEQGITKGTSDTAFSPDATCTRAQIVTFLWRANGSPVVSGNSAFTDVAADAYYAAAVTWAEKNGVTGGIGNGLFGSGNNCTRAQIVTFLWRCKK